MMALVVRQQATTVYTTYNRATRVADLLHSSHGRCSVAESSSSSWSVFGKLLVMLASHGTLLEALPSSNSCACWVRGHFCKPRVTVPHILKPSGNCNFLYLIGVSNDNRFILSPTTSEIPIVIAVTQPTTIDHNRCT